MLIISYVKTVNYVMRQIRKRSSNLNTSEMEKIIEIKGRSSGNSQDSELINKLLDKVKELTRAINELNSEVAVIHEWKIEKEGI